MPEPTNPADVPASWLPGQYQEHPKPPAYQRAVARTVNNRRWLKTVDMAEMAGKLIGGKPHLVDDLEKMTDRWWKDLAAAAGHPSRKPPSTERREAVIDKLRRDLEPP